MAERYEVSVLFKLMDRLTNPARKISRGLEGLQKKVGRLGKSMRRLGKGLTAGVTLPLAGLGLMAIKKAADIETMTVAFESMLGSGEKATDMVKELINFTARTPFQLEGVGKAAKQLLGFGVAQEKITDRLKVLGDIASGANVPLTDMSSIYGKIISKGKAMTEELLQMSDRGIPIIKELSEGLGVAKDKIFELASQGKLTAPIVIKALENMSRAGGIFANQMEKQSATMAGLYSTLKDNVVLALAEIGKILIENLDLKNLMEKAIVWIQKAVEAFKKFSEAHPGLVKLGVLIAGLAVVAGPLLIVVGSIAAGWAFLSSTMLIVAGVIAGVGAAIAALIIYWEDLTAVVKKVGQLFMETFSAIKQVIYDTWIAPIKEAIKWIDKLMSSKAFQFMGKVFGGQPGAAVPAGMSSAAGAMAAPMGFNKSETEVRIKVSSDEGSTATVEKVKRKGDASVKVDSYGYVGMAFAMGN